MSSIVSDEQLVHLQHEVAMGYHEVETGKILACVLIATIVSFFLLFGLIQAYVPRALPDDELIRILGEWGVDFAFDHTIVTILILAIILGLGAAGDDLEEVKQANQRSADAVLRPYLEHLKSAETAAEQDLRSSVRRVVPLNMNLHLTIKKD